MSKLLNFNGNVCKSKVCISKMNMSQTIHFFISNFAKNYAFFIFIFLMAKNHFFSKTSFGKSTNHNFELEMPKPHENHFKTICRRGFSPF